jgi:thymidylate kinase
MILASLDRASLDWVPLDRPPRPTDEQTVRVLEQTCAPRGAAEGEASPLVRALTDELEAVGISYCHWKGNAFVDRALRAEDDLDLLVRRRDVASFVATLHRLGFREARSPAADVPGVSHYYGYDRQADRLVHVHAYYQLIVGDDLTENYRIPLEDALLAASVRDKLVRVPPPELELIAFVIRKVLEHCTWEATVLGCRKVPRKAYRELAFLQARADRALVDRLLEQHLPFIDPELFAACLHALEPQAGRRARMRAGRRLLARLEPYSRRSRAVDASRKVRRRSVEVARRLRSKPAPRKRLPTGGALVAVVGADGAGKSTAVEALFQWLSEDFAVTRIHLGKPPWSRTTFFVRGFLKARSKLPTLRRRRVSNAAPTAAMLLALMTARDRSRLYSKACRFALDGGVVICDRFPLPQLTLMDAPRIERTVGTAGRLAKAMSRLEKRYYRALAPPDVLIVLRVDPEIAVRRQPGDDPDYVRGRWREIWEIDWRAVGAHVIDAGRAPGEVIAEVKSLVWSEL